MLRRRWAQRKLGFLVFLVLLAASFAGTGFQSASAQQDLSPTPGTQPVIPEIPTAASIIVFSPFHQQLLRGVVNITGSITLDNWTSYEVAFSYADNATPVWFPIAGGKNPLENNTLASWDTTTLSDGDYNLRLRVFSPDGASQDAFVYGLRVRNYTVDTPVPTLTFTPTATPIATALPTATPTPTLTPYSTPTALPPNPATLSVGEIDTNLGFGVALAVVLFGIFGALLRLRHR